MKYLLLVILLMPLALWGQVTDNFESGLLSGWSFNETGRWSADNQAPISGLWSLHHSFDNSDSGIDMAAISIETLRADLGMVTWCFSIRHGYDPSSSNNWGIYLASDCEVREMAPGREASGFILGVNMSGYDDTLRIWRSNQGSLTKVVTASVNWQTDIGISQAAMIIVTRTADGEWSVSVGQEGEDPSLKGTASDPEWYPNRWFGICYRYSSTRDQLLWFDDLLIDGVFIDDHQPPVVIEAYFTSQYEITLELNEVPDPDFTRNNNFLIMGINLLPLSVRAVNEYIYTLRFSDQFRNKQTFTLRIGNLCDIKGNCSYGTEVLVILAFPEPGDIVISEFMPDPDPPAGLPACEYVEIHNRSNYGYAIETLELTIGERRFFLPAGTIEPGDYLILCDDGCDWSNVSGIQPVVTDNFPAITNGGTAIILADKAGITVHGFEFTSSWFNDILKSDGGWSLEMIDLNYPFQSSENWRYSCDRRGGTPGEANSVSAFNPDIIPPWLYNLFPLSDTTLLAQFSEPVSVNQPKPGDYEIQNAEVTGVSGYDRLYTSYLVTLEDILDPSQEYLLTVPESISDLGGNPVQRRQLGFGIPLRSEFNDMVINEILFDALPWESEYIELFNRSEKVIDINDLFFARVNLETGDTSMPAWLSDSHRCIMPGDYWVSASDRESILSNYSSSDPYSIFEGELPGLPDDGGILLLFNREHTLIDRVEYSSDMHFDLLSSTEGVSLERINPGVPSDYHDNWHSASGSSGWGTPGILNSVTFTGGATESVLSLSSGTISPDNDGFEDILGISINVEEEGVVIQCLIFNDMGRCVRTLAGNTTAGIMNEFFWDALTDDGRVVQRGIYIIYVKLTGQNGYLRQFKKVCAVLR